MSSKIDVLNNKLERAKKSANGGLPSHTKGYLSGARQYATAHGIQYPDAQDEQIMGIAYRQGVQRQLRGIEVFLGLTDEGFCAKFGSIYRSCQIAREFAEGGNLSSEEVAAMKQGISAIERRVKERVVVLRF